MRALLLLTIILLSGCVSNQHTAYRDNFKFEFGHIIEAGEFYELDKRGSKIQWEKGKLEPKFGVRVENLSKNKYVLAWTILKLNKVSEIFNVFSSGGFWTIGPPTNLNYEAFLWSDEKDYELGDYEFVVYINGLNVKRFGFTIES
jgi:hypothetical protein